MATKLTKATKGDLLVKGTVIRYQWHHMSLDVDLDALILITKDTRIGYRGYANGLVLWTDNTEWQRSSSKGRCSMAFDKGVMKQEGFITLKGPL